MADVAIVTGGTGSIGSATARRLVQDRYNVVLADVNEPKEPIVGCTFATLDVRSAGSVADLFRYAATLGTLKVVVNTHGILHETPIDTFDTDQIEAIVAINLTGTMRMAEAAGEHLADNGAMVFLSSITASIGRAHGGLCVSRDEGRHRVDHARLCRSAW